jgi:cytochrome P450
MYDTAFAKDDLKSLHFFSLGPRACLGRELAWAEGKLLMAKLLWSFDVIRVPGQSINLEETLLHYGFLQKPDFKAQFIPVAQINGYH